MPAGLTAISSLDQTVVAKYQSDFLMWSELYEHWGQFVNWKEAIPQDGGGGSSFDYPVFHELVPATTALTETNDIEPVAMADSNVTITPTEYGSGVRRTLKLAFQSRVDVRDAASQAVGQNRAKSIDHIIRAALGAASWKSYTYGAALRTALGTTNHIPTFQWITQMVQQARALGVPPWEGDTYVSVVNPVVLVDLMALGEWKYPVYYQPGQVKNLFKGEVGMLGGLRFISSPHGKLYLSGGLTAQAATTLAASVAAGATTLSVATSNGLAAGSYISLGTKEAAGTEVVQVTAQSTVDLTVRGYGNAFSNFGCAYSHDNGAAVTEAAHVAQIPVIGRDTMWGVYGATTGRYGVPKMTEGPDSGDLLGRFLFLGWLWYGGITALAKYAIQGECATVGEVLGKITDY